MEYVAEYQQVARDYHLSQTQKLHFLHNLLIGDAKRYYLDRVDGHAVTFQQAVDLVESEYNSALRQNRVNNHLNSLRLSLFVAECLNLTAALEKAYKLITKLAPQVPCSHRGDAHKMEFLRNATIGNSLATEPLSRIATHQLSFQVLYGDLEAPLQLENESKRANLHDNASIRSSGDEEVAGILYEGQGKYIRRHVGLNRFPDRTRRSSKPIASSSTSFDPLSISGCFNCVIPLTRSKIAVDQ